MVQYDYQITEADEYTETLPVCVACGLESEVLVVDDRSPMEDSRCPDCWALLRSDEPDMVVQTMRFLESVGAV